MDKNKVCYFINIKLINILLVLIYYIKNIEIKAL